ncbi:MAG: 50S ribosomal protein L5 [Clostridiales Family XIII bacterium]|jgi:large subunit ribosomal protein L5|nr:50S ribosomal protein L5 [Clostridiales Family XIII bacterium]
MERLSEIYKNEIVKNMQKKFGYKNVNQVPKISKLVINMGLGEAKDNGKVIESALKELAAITGQRPVSTKAKKSISNFKLRQGVPIGAMITLRGNRMYVFLDKLLNIVLPRVRDFHGTSVNSFDGRGNYSIGLKEQTIFPEIVYDEVDTVKGMNINFITTAKTDEEAKELLTLLGMPFEDIKK